MVNPLGSLHPPWDSPPSVPLVVVWDIMRLQRRNGSGKCTAEAGKLTQMIWDKLRIREVGRWGGKEIKKENNWAIGLKPLLSWVTVLRSEV